MTTEFYQAVGLNKDGAIPTRLHKGNTCGHRHPTPTEAEACRDYMAMDINKPVLVVAVPSATQRPYTVTDSVDAEVAALNRLYSL